VLTLREIAALTLRIVERRRALVPLPFGVARLVAWSTEVASTLSLGRFPPKVLTVTRDEVELLRHDNVVSAKAIAEGRTLRELRINPQGIEAAAPSYLYRFRKTGQYAARRLA
jgi:NADH dehydrogenase